MKKYLVLLVILFASFYCALAQAVEPDTVWTLNLLPDGPVNCVKYFPDGTKFVNNSGSYVQIRETATGKLLKQFVHQSPEILSIDVSKDGKYVFASGTNTNYIGMWDVETGIERRFMDDIEYSGVYSLSISPDSKKIVATMFNGGNIHGAIIMWDIESGKVLHKIDELYGGWKIIKFFNKSNYFIVTKGRNPWRIFIYNADSFGVIKELEFKYKGELYEIPDMDISMDDKYLAVINNVSTPDTSNVKIWNLIDYSIFKTLNIGALAAVDAVKLSKDLKFVEVGYIYWPNAFIYRFDLASSVITQKYDIVPIGKICLCQANAIDTRIISGEEQILYAGGAGVALIHNSKTGISERGVFMKSFELIYPNPTSGQINIKVNLQVPDVLLISLFKLTGQKIDFSYAKQFDVGQVEIPINVGFLDKGFYIIKVEGKNFSKTLKLVKE